METLQEKMARLQRELENAQKEYEEQMSPAQIIEREGQKAAQLIAMAAQEAVNKIQAAMRSQIAITPPKGFAKLSQSQLMMTNASNLSCEKALVFLDRVMTMYPPNIAEALKPYPDVLLYHLAVVSGVLPEGK